MLYSAFKMYILDGSLFIFIHRRQAMLNRSLQTNNGK